MLNQNNLPMAQIYHFKKSSRDKKSDYDTSYAFRTYTGWLHLNKMATKLTEFDDYIEVELEDWYLSNDNKNIDQAIKRRLTCEKLQDSYLSYKQKKND